MVKLQLPPVQRNFQTCSSGLSSLSFGPPPLMSLGDYLLNAPLLFSISRTKVKALVINRSQPKSNIPLDLPMSAPSSSCLSRPKILQSSLTTLSPFFLLSREATYCIKSSFIIADRFPNFCPFPLFLENSRHSWLFCLQLFFCPCLSFRWARANKAGDRGLQFQKSRAITGSGK